MNTLIEQKLKIQIDKILHSIFSVKNKNLHFIPYNQDVMFLAAEFEATETSHNKLLYAYTDFYDLARKIVSFTQNDFFIVFVPIMTTDTKTNIESSLEFSLNKYNASLPNANCLTIFIKANFLTMHETLCFIHEQILKYITN